MSTPSPEDLERRLRSLEARVTELERPVARALRRAGTAAAGATLRTASRAGRSLEQVARRAARSMLRRLGLRRAGTDSVTLRVHPRPAIPWPALSVVVRAAGTEAPAWRRVEAALRAQTIRSVEWLLWDEAAGTLLRLGPGAEPPRPQRAADGAAVRQVARGRFLAWAGAPFPAFPPTWLETAVWVLAAEGLPAVVFDPGPRGLLPPGCGFADRVVVRRELWGLEEGLDAAAFRGMKDPVLAKVVRAAGGPPFPAGADGSTLFPASFPAHRLQGPYAFAAASPTGGHDLGITPLDAALVEPPCTDQRPTALVLMPFLAVGGAEKLTLDVMKELRERVRFVVVTLVGHDPVLGDCIDRFRELTPFVYTVGELLPPQLFFSTLAHLLRTFEVATLFNANGTTFFYDALSSIRELFPRLTIVNQLFDHAVGWIDYTTPQVAADVDVHVATNAAIEDELVARRAVPAGKVVHVPHGIVLDEFRPGDYGPSRLEEVRARLGAPAGKTVVSLVVRMHPQKRPLDFVALAERCRDDAGLFFLLVGGGPVEHEVDARISAAGLPNARRIGFFSPLPDLLAATDVVCMTSEYEALPLVVLSALAMERPVVATDVGAIRSVLEDGPCGVVVPRVGDLDAFRAALSGLAAPEARLELGRRGRAVVERRFSIARCARQYEAALLGTGGKA